MGTLGPQDCPVQNIFGLPYIEINNVSYLVKYLGTYRLVGASCDAPWQGSRGGDMHLTALVSPRGGSA